MGNNDLNTRQNRDMLKRLISDNMGIIRADIVKSTKYTLISDRNNLKMQEELQECFTAITKNFISVVDNNRWDKCIELYNNKKTPYYSFNFITLCYYLIYLQKLVDIMSLNVSKNNTSNIINISTTVLNNMKSAFKNEVRSCDFDGIFMSNENGKIISEPLKSYQALNVTRDEVINNVDKIISQLFKDSMLVEIKARALDSIMVYLDTYNSKNNQTQEGVIKNNAGELSTNAELKKQAFTPGRQTTLFDYIYREI